MTPRSTLILALQILAVAALLALVAWASRHDAEVEQASLQNYCELVAMWQYDASLGIEPFQRNGQPDYRGIAAEHCPGLRLATEADTHDDQRQLASHHGATQ